MQFFEDQQRAHRLTKILIIWFILAVLLCIAIIYLLLQATVGMVDVKNAELADWFNPELFLLVLLGVGGVIVLASVIKTWSLSRGGGAAVASSLGGKLVDVNTEDANERKLINVVQEMAIAAGINVPPIYLMEHENSINAFAAGFKPQDAVIGVTKGAITHLTRDELQAVIAHEFSHIFNGDMRINMQLMGVLFGLICVYYVGRFVVRATSGGRSKKGNQIVVVGIALIVVGLIGWLFGRIIQAAISRQRELLADASAIQFTRNPVALKTALKKIVKIGAEIENPNAEQASHMFFQFKFSGLFASHPPIKERIKRINRNIKSIAEADSVV